MRDPAEIIAETILKPPPQPGHHDENFAWQYSITMGNAGAPELARHIAEATIQALTDAGYRLVPPSAANGPLPSADQIRRWLTCHEWKQGDPGGEAGALWYAPVPRTKGVGVPHDDSDTDLISGAIMRIADRMMMSPDQVLAEMLTYADE